jgi:hypothetical protein
VSAMHTMHIPFFSGLAPTCFGNFLVILSVSTILYALDLDVDDDQHDWFRDSVDYARAHLEPSLISAGVMIRYIQTSTSSSSI